MCKYKAQHKITHKHELVFYYIFHNKHLEPMQYNEYAKTMTHETTLTARLNI